MKLEKSTLSKFSLFCCFMTMAVFSKASADDQFTNEQVMQCAAMFYIKDDTLRIHNPTVEKDFTKFPIENRDFLKEVTRFIVKRDRMLQSKSNVLKVQEALKAWIDIKGRLSESYLMFESRSRLGFGCDPFFTRYPL